MIFVPLQFPMVFFYLFSNSSCSTETNHGLFNIGIYNHNNTRGSSMVKIGATIVSCGITVQVGTPIPHRPTDGDISTRLCY